MAGFCECGNECLVSIKCGELIDQLKTSLFLRKDTAQLSCLFIYLFVYLFI